MKISFFTLGCKVNQYESQEMLSSLAEHGFEPAAENENADVYVVNSCTVTSESSRKSKQTLRRLRNEHPEAVIVLTGCYSQAFGEEASKIIEADIVLGNNTNNSLPEALESYFSEHKRITNIKPHTKDEGYKGGIITEFEGHTRAFVKIQDGCNRYCSYCIIPYSKGFSRSKPLENIKNEVSALAQRGFREIVFVGINLSSYGMDLGLDIADALSVAQNTPGIDRIRLGSLEPDHITDSVIEKLSGMSKFCPQFHLSLQSGSDEILKRMNRHYNTAEYAELCEKLRRAFPDASITTDIIVGFPGESDKNFLETLDFTRRIRFMKAHIFPFSPREGTPAASYPDKITSAKKIERAKLLQTECDVIRQELIEAEIGKTCEVLFETPKGKYQHGYTENYTPVAVENDTSLSGKILKVMITGTDEEGSTGALI